MAWIERFAIKGLAGREDVCARELNRHVNVFFGLNGSGKTSLLKILHSALGNDATPLRTVYFESAEVHVYSPKLKRSVIRRVERSQLPQEPETAESGLRVWEHMLVARGRGVQKRSSPAWNSDPADASTETWSHSFLS